MLGFRQMPWSSSSAQAQAPSEQLCEGAAAVVAARQGMETPLTAVAEAFEELARGMEADSGELRLAPFSDTCALVSVLFSSLGMAFRFAEIEYVTKVNDLIGAGKSYRTLSDILDKDIQKDCVKKQGSHSRNLRRVRLGLGLIKALFEQFLATEDSRQPDRDSGRLPQPSAGRRASVSGDPRSDPRESATVDDEQG